MQTAQGAFEAALETLAARYDHDVIKQASFANTGRLTLVHAGTFTETVSFDYHFDTGQNVFERAHIPATSGYAPIFANKPNPRMYIAHTVAELQRVLDAIEAILSTTTR